MIRDIFKKKNIRVPPTTGKHGLKWPVTCTADTVLYIYAPFIISIISGYILVTTARYICLLSRPVDPNGVCCVLVS